MTYPNKKIMLAAVLIVLSLSAKAHMDESKAVCASCDWPKKSSCGSITTKQVVSLRLENHNPVTSEAQEGPYTTFSCGNGRTELGVLWTDKECGQTGGLSGLPTDMFPEITHKPECKFEPAGNEKNKKRSLK